ncbi:Cyk3p NDAI_0B03330 [Naumovozyma dairenensis CBS 421]|uniref:SH3 domain-containing protein n=1 Tax=Naumovozyma dairenensis (strain ATCC 10597 / BCRC 20456 / CBS 421 / NBRC 0211 / NRRL Y-12639) TaxID=1071378 RepID=G0W6F6_NAUDC|nr:hypothetical protein NDAI_0B03330 [Naumovozyma dairenensis CBS 421]CCD23367.1 hypothetical protein NDAI_0B03330 [Naumovozyma dairenensis CBS 421]
MTSNISSSLKPPFKVRAKYGWSGQAKGDLGFLEGDIMEVTRVAGDWFYGKLLRNRKCAGYFPNNFVTLLEERLNEAPGNSQDSSRRTTTTTTKKEQQMKTSVPAIPSRESARSHRDNSASTLPSFPHSRQPLRVSNSSPSFPEYSRNMKVSTTTTPSYYPNEKQRRQNRETYHEPKQYVYQQQRSSYSTRNDKFNESLNNPLPPLPPLPAISMKDSSRDRLPTKSYSSNDINSSLSKDYNYYKENQNFYDGFYPTKKSILSNDDNHTSNSNPSSSSSSSNLFSNSKYLDNSLTSSENSFALMSDFSATSAGSFARHKYAQSFTNSLEKSQSISNKKNTDTINSNDNSFTTSGNRMSGFFKKMMTKSATHTNNDKEENDSYPKLPALEDLNISNSHGDARDWLTIKSHINRSRTLTKYDKHPRYMRALEEHRDIVLHPQDSIYDDLSTNETKGSTNSKPGLVDIELSDLKVEYIDKMTWKRCTNNKKLNQMKIDSWANLTFSARYATTMEKLRGIYIFCTEMFALIDDNGSSDFSKEPPNLDQLLYQNHCTPYQLTWLFQRLANSLGITCEIVIGFLKTPGSQTTEFKYNHCWLRVLVNREWRLIDVILGNLTNPIHEFVNNEKKKKAENYYFLAQPLDFIYTHIPPRDFEQHIVPSIDQLSALYLPLVFPSFFKNSLKLYKFCTALSFLEDSEIYECQLEIPSDIELFTSVVISDDNDNATPIPSEKLSIYNSMDLTLTQMKRHKMDSSRRIAIIKAVLPPGAEKGSLYIHSGLRGTQTTLVNVHPLSVMIPLTHKGNESEFEFVTRLPSENVQRIETYIMEPQNKILFVDNEYNFEIIQQPFDGVIYNKDISRYDNELRSMAIKSPSGKIYSMVKNDPHFPYGTWKKNINIKEVGTWTGLIMDDSGIGWCPFAEWVCT